MNIYVDVVFKDYAGAFIDDKLKIEALLNHYNLSEKRFSKQIVFSVGNFVAVYKCNVYNTESVDFINHTITPENHTNFFLDSMSFRLVDAINKTQQIIKRKKLTDDDLVVFIV